MCVNPSYDCTILILTYKGLEHLKYLLPTVEDVVMNTIDYTVNVLIVDNGCDNKTKEFVESEFPQFEYTYSYKNDYLFSLNPFVRKLTSRLVCILNDDMRMDSDALNQSIPIFTGDDKLFSVAFRVLDWKGENITVSARKMEYSKGWIKSYFSERLDDEIRYTLYGGGGAALFRTEYFNRLDGFNILYRPAYAEDLDLGHRAWHRGMHSVINPKSVLYHREGGTINEQYSSNKLERQVRKNQFLWMIRNSEFRGFFAIFTLLLPYRLLIWIFQNRNLFFGFIWALPRIPLAILQRLAEKKPIISDNDIIKKLDTKYEA